ncbi:MAG TPA: helix-turn-helix domain-containing protein [Burkholderiales bacterium]|nr:helix-turn-helix domain-containing protein [Burkholderiales bacterium]
MSDMRKTDSRVRRTKLLLHRSLATLIHEKSYDAIVVKEILARANVARSTFYAHFDGKEELLLSSIRHVLAAAREHVPELSDPVDRLLYFGLPVLQHIETHLQRAPVDAPRPGQRQVHRRLERVLIEQLEADIRRAPLDRITPAMPPELLAKHLVSTFLVVIDWCMHRQPAPSAREAHDLYRSLVEPALRTVRRD